MTDYFNPYEQFEPEEMIDLQALDINDILSEGSYRERMRIIKLLENKINSIPFHVGNKSSDKLIIKKTIREVIRVLRAENDKDYRQTA